MSFVTPIKAITDASLLQKFLDSPTCTKYVQFLEDLNESVKGLANDAPVESNEVNHHSYPF